MTKLREIFSIVLNHFTGHLEQPQRQAEELFCDLLKKSRAQLYEHFEQELNMQQYEQSLHWMERRLNGEPLAYICGQVNFYGCSLKVNGCVLIPRQETEILVDEIVQQLTGEDLDNKMLWDLCCGSGCIGIALKKKFPSLKVIMSDYSPDALLIARQNAYLNQVDVSCLEGDLLSVLAGEKVNMIVCNPPYISTEEFTSCEKDVRCYEPREALIGGKTGLEFYRRLAGDLPNFLLPHGRVWLEIGHKQGVDMMSIFEDFLTLQLLIFVFHFP